jgi:FkbM family methyltransferase
MLGIAKPSYLDLGANDPVWLSNTYLFYRIGCRGVCVEPNPRSCEAIKRARPRDVCLPYGVGTVPCVSAPFYIMDPPTLSSFSKEFVEANLANASYRLKKTITIPLMTSSEIIAAYFSTPPTCVSIDVEGHDEQIVKAWDFDRYRPEVFCVETVSHHDRVKVRETTAVFTQAGYVAFADTFINTIYVESQALERWRAKA